MKENYCKAHN